MSHLNGRGELFYILFFFFSPLYVSATQLAHFPTKVFYFVWESGEVIVVKNSNMKKKISQIFLFPKRFSFFPIFSNFFPFFLSFLSLYSLEIISPFDPPPIYFGGISQYTIDIIYII